MANTFPITDCDCGSADHHGSDNTDRVYYTSVLDDGGTRAILAAGPFDTHRAALAAIPAVKRYVSTYYEDDPRSPWFSYGTASRLRVDVVESRHLDTLA